jgi:sporulation protein YlmC with PRC-barrel domain
MSPETEDKGAEGSKGRSSREAARLGHLLAPSRGYEVVTADGHAVGVIEDLRYQQHSEHPDAIIVRRRGLLGRRRNLVPFYAVESVDQRRQQVVLRIDRRALNRLPRPGLGVRPRMP